MDGGYIDHEVNITVEDIYEKANRLLLSRRQNPVFCRDDGNGQRY